MNEADTCRKCVLPKLYDAAWTDEQINEQRTFTDGRIVIAEKRPLHHPQKRTNDRLLDAFRYPTDSQAKSLDGLHVSRMAHREGKRKREGLPLAQVVGVDFLGMNRTMQHNRVVGRQRELHIIRVR